MRKLNHFGNHLLKKWYLYLLWAIFSICACSVMFTLLTAPKREDKINFFISSYGYDNALIRVLNNKKPNAIKEIDFAWVSPDTDDFNVYFSTYGLIDADIIILPERKIAELNISACFAPFAADLFGDFEMYAGIDGKNYGVKVFSKNDLSGCALSYITYTNGDVLEDYYLFINKKSDYAELLNGEENFAIEVAKAFMTL